MVRFVLRVLPLIIATFVVVQAAGAAPLDLKVQTKLGIRENVHLSFKAAPLPEGGYYYAVIVLKKYKHYTRKSPPPCSVSSNMQRTDYGYSNEGSVVLALTPATSHANHWCPSGIYEGGVYAVPHAPPCESAYPCRAEAPTKTAYHCNPEVERCFFGVVALLKEWQWPDPLPRPIAKGTTIIDHFTIKFPKGS